MSENAKSSDNGCGCLAILLCVLFLFGCLDKPIRKASQLWEQGKTEAYNEHDND